MNKLIGMLLIFISCTSIGQEYKLFSNNSKLLFASQAMEVSTNGIAFDSVLFSGSDSIFYNYTVVDSELFESDTCEFWGGPYCYAQEVPSWMGLKIISDNICQYAFLNKQYDTIPLNFGLFPGDSALIFKDETQSFYMISIGTDTSSILNVTDSVRKYTIAHYDTALNVINSALNGQPIRIGKETGLIDFFRIDSFPMVLQPISLIGHELLSLGLTRLTNEMIYDHQPGDVIQYHDFKYMEGGPPWFNYDNYVTHTFLERQETQDSLIYLVDRLTYNTDTSALIYDTITLKYKKNVIIAEIPFDKINQQSILRTTSLSKIEYCGIDLWTYRIIPEYLAYCAEDNCWGHYDIPGPPPWEIVDYVEGLGLYRDRSSIAAPPPEGYQFYWGIVYFKKDGIECGQQVVVDLDELSSPHDLSVVIYPNPARDKLVIESLNSIELVEIYDLRGLKIFEQYIPIGENEIKIDVSKLVAGMYVCCINSSNKKVVKKLIIQ